MKRPADCSDAEWAEIQQCQAEHDNLMDQVADREAQMEQGFIDTYDEYEFDYTTPVRPAQPPHPADHTQPSPLRSTSHRSGRAR
ncbi:hypothetical protein ACFU99_30900 [Streptomyces sp. NPDC057654]|uniref:hypothetical protein n=1 Tax=Streptomyces sp. NPDC057654 TaxID=3346196 RepID=UPI0036B2288C